MFLIVRARAFLIVRRDSQAGRVGAFLIGRGAAEFRVSGLPYIYGAVAAGPRFVLSGTLLENRPPLVLPTREFEGRMIRR